MDWHARPLLLRGGAAKAALLVIAGAFATPVAAQVGATGGAGAPSVAPPPVVTGRADALGPSGGNQDALIAGDWLLYPSAFAGGVYDTNPRQLANGARSGGGFRVSPSLLGETNDGFAKTILYGMADARLYLDQGAANGNAVSARAGATEIYQPLPDLVFTGQGDFTRQKDLFSTLGVANNLVTLNTSAVGLAPTTNPNSYNQVSGAASVQKNFANTFLTFGGSIVDIMYEHDRGAISSSPSGVTYTGTGRGGLWITPALYSFVEGSLDTRDYTRSAFNSSGYRTVGGLGTDQIGLWKGEVFGGFQSEKFRSAGIGTSSGPAFGARLYYSPLPELAINLSIDETIGASLLAATPTFAAGTSTKFTNVVGSAAYSIAPEWSTSGRAGYIHTDYGSNPRRDDSWTIGTTLTYNFWRNIGLTADYQHIDLRSNVALQNFDRDVITVGITYRY